MPRARKSPAPPKPRSESAAETRDALIEAGLALFGNEGLDVSLDAICARAGKTRGAFYVHFPDRDAFLDAVMERAGASYLEAVVGSDDGPDLATIVKRFVASVRRGEYPLTRQGGPRPHQLLDACARSEAVRARYVALIEQAVGRVQGAIDHGRDDGTVRADLDPKIGARLLLAAVIGAQTLLELGVAVDVPRSAAQLMALVAPPSRKR